ncbi:cell division ATP-binding protein FtsE [bacterium]|nr:MAG: cell division ATP-binding protein FtsE [bacterium]
MSNVIELSNVSLHYESKPILKNVHFSLGNGEFVYLIGPTGAGKSSFLKLLYKDVEPDEGQIKIADYDLNSLKDKQVPFLRRSLGIVFQDFQLLPDRNVYDNVAFAMHVVGAKNTQIKQRVIEALQMVGLSQKRHEMPNDLSGGEQQRVVIARALANEPRIMLADEPTGNLDPFATIEIMNLLKTINNRGMAILMVTHNYDVVKKYKYRTVRLENGDLKEVTI